MGVHSALKELEGGRPPPPAALLAPASQGSPQTFPSHLWILGSGRSLGTVQTHRQTHAAQLCLGFLLGRRKKQVEVQQAVCYAFGM